MYLFLGCLSFFCVVDGVGSMKGGKLYGGGKNGGGVLGEFVWVVWGNMGKGNGNRFGEGNFCFGC